MNLESRQEVNCTLPGEQNDQDKKEIKRKLWTHPKELIATQNGRKKSPSKEDAPGVHPELVPRDQQQPKLQGERRVSPLQKIHSLPEKMLWPGMILFGNFIMALIWKLMQDMCPHMLPGNTRAKCRKRKHKRKEKLRRLLLAKGLGPLSVEAPYQLTWDRERGRTSSRSGTDDGFPTTDRDMATLLNTPRSCKAPTDPPGGNSTRELNIMRHHHAGDKQGLWTLLQQGHVQRHNGDLLGQHPTNPKPRRRG